MAEQESANANDHEASGSESAWVQANLAFRFGFFLPTLWEAHDDDVFSRTTCFRMVQETVDGLAEQIHPSVFAGLLDVLNKLYDLVPDFSQTPNNYRGAMPDVVQRWRTLALRAVAFGRDAIPQTSVHRKWFDCGADLGVLRRYPHDWQGHRLRILQKKVQKLSDVIFEADPWLEPVLRIR